jgi:hypothetical protein
MIMLGRRGGVGDIHVQVGMKEEMTEEIEVEK